MRGGWRHSNNVSKYCVPSALYEVADVFKFGQLCDSCVLDFIKPAYAEDLSLAAHMDGLQARQIGGRNCSCFGGVEQNRNDKRRVQVQSCGQGQVGLSPYP